MRKLLSTVLVLIFALGLMTGCGAAPQETAAAGPKLRVLTTIFPIYDWTLNVVGDRGDKVEVTMLVDNGVDLHSYQPSAEDIVRMSACDLLIYVGGESDAWVADVLREGANKNMRVISLLDVLGDAVKEEEIVEGMEQDQDDEDGHDHESPELDEHVWLSLKNAVVLVGAIADALGQLDGENASLYASNADAYTDKLNALDGRYREVVDGATHHTLLFGDRFPFRYLVDDYGLDYYAAFAGCSAETEASFETVVFLAGKLDELGLPAVLQIESANSSIARTVVENSKSGDRQILTLDSMQSVTAKDIAAGASYLSAMEKNLDVLKAALG